MISRAIGRLISICLGATLGLLAALATLFFAGGLFLTKQFQTTSTTMEQLGLEKIWSTFALGIEILPLLSLLPVLIALLIGELGRIRSIYYYVIAGGLCLAFGPLVHVLVNQGQASLPNPQLFAIFLTSGFAGGLTYWFIAGRTTN